MARRGNVGEEFSLEDILAEMGAETKEVAATFRKLRPAPGEEGYVLNEKGKPIKAEGRAAKALEKKRRDELIQAGYALPTGYLKDSSVLRTEAKEVTRRGKPKEREEGPAPWDMPGKAKRYGAYVEQKWAAAGHVATLADFARTIAARVKATPNFRQAVVSYVNREGDAYNKTIKIGIDTKESEVLKKLEGFDKGETYAAGSDSIPTDYMPDISGFRVGSIVYSKAAGLKFAGVSRPKARDHPHFKLVELAAKADPGDCFLAVLRAVARAHGLQPPKQHNKTIRSSLGLPTGPISMDDETVGKLARLFGLRVRVTSGMVVPPDAERVYDDNGERAEGRNLCATEAYPEIIAEGGDESAPDCFVYYGDDHCEYIDRILEPILTCPVTGDILKGGQALTEKEQRARVLQQGRRWYASPIKPKTAKKSRAKKFDERVIVYDYETTYDADGVLEPYALGYIVLPADSLEDSDFSRGSGKVVQVFRGKADTSLHVSSSLLDTLAAAPDDVRYTLVSFNGSRFDHYLLAKAAHRRQQLTNIFATSGGGLRSLQLGRHKTLDLAKLIPGMSLADCCREFATQPVKVEGFSHRLPQAAAEEGKLFDWIGENCEKLSEYLEGDVLSTASLLVKLRKALLAATDTDIISSKAPGTIGGIAWNRMQVKCRLPAAVATKQEDDYIRGAITGGRVQVYGETPTIIKSRQMRMGDVVSLYPTAMAAVDKVAALFAPSERWGFYPDTDHERPQEVTSYTPGDVGVFTITVHSQPEGLPNVLPKRTEGEPLDWGFRGEFETTATHIDIALILAGGGRVTVHRGYRWPVTVQGLFRPYVEELAAKKNEQDKLKAARDPTYNAALRQVYKLLMNAASGKCCQKNYDDITAIATGSAAQIAAEKKMQRDSITWIPIGGETVVMCGKKLAGAVYKRACAKPSILAVLIYAYSRAYVWRTLCQHNVLYSDTDSGLFEVADWESLCKTFPQLIPTGRPKELGDIEEELGEHHHANVYLKAPKDYAILTKDKEGNPVTKMDKGERVKTEKVRVKGVHLRGDRQIVGDAAALGEMSLEELAKEYSGPATELTRPIADDVDGFFEEHAVGEVKVLCSQIQRSYKDGANPFVLRQRFLVKEL